MKYPKLLTLLTLAALAAACQPKSGAPAAASTGAAAAPVATVNGVPISSALFEFYVKGVSGKSVADLSPDQRQQLLDNLIHGEVVAQQGEKDGLDKEPLGSSVIELARLNAMQQLVSEHYLKDKKPTEQQLRTEYETQVAALPKQEYHARHILVATEPFAQKVIAELDKGGNFTDIAKRESMDPSKDNGGDLGWFSPDRMVKPFADAAMALKPGEYTHKPVQTQFGWHVIQLEGVRDVAAPPFDQVRQRLEQVVQTKKFKDYVDSLMKTAKVDKKS